MDFVERMVCVDPKRRERPEVCCCSPSVFVVLDLMLNAWGIIFSLGGLGDRLKQVLYFLGGVTQYQPSPENKTTFLRANVLIIRYLLFNTEFLALLFVITLIAIASRNPPTLKGVIFFRYVCYVGGYIFYIGMIVLAAFLLQSGKYKDVAAGRTIVIFGFSLPTSPKALMVTILVLWIVCFPVLLLWQTLVVRSFIYYLRSIPGNGNIVEKERKHLLVDSTVSQQVGDTYGAADV